MDVLMPDIGNELPDRVLVIHKPFLRLTISANSGVARHGTQVPSDCGSRRDEQPPHAEVQAPLKRTDSKTTPPAPELLIGLRDRGRTPPLARGPLILRKKPLYARKLRRTLRRNHAPVAQW